MNTAGNAVYDRAAFRDWFRGELRRMDFWHKRTDHYLVREFSKYCAARGEVLGVNLDIDEASLGRYLRDEDPVLPTPERIRALCLVLDVPILRPLVVAGYLRLDDFTHEALLDAGIDPAALVATWRGRLPGGTGSGPDSHAEGLQP